MVTYLETSATKSITVLSLEVGTTLTITAPSEVVQGIAFGISGYLTRNDTGAGIPNATVTLSYNGTLLGSDTTSIDGHYLLTGSVMYDLGTFTLTAYFAGSTGLGASSAFKGIRLGEPSLLPLLALLGIAAYAIFKKG